MRIVAGIHRGRQLLRPPATITRPTMDKVRESIFNVLRNGNLCDRGNVVEDAIVLDVFAGSGALSLEALSQGANFAYMLEKNHHAQEIIRKNINNLKEHNRVKLLNANALHPPKAPMTAPNLIFFDPPFGHNLTARSLPMLEARSWIANDAICVAEIESSEELNLPSGYKIIKERVYGTAKVFFFQKD